MSSRSRIVSRNSNPAWNKDDTTAMAAVWADDGSLINPVGASAQGRDEIVKVFVQEHTSPGPFKATKYSTSDVKFQWVTPDVAVVDASANISGIRGSDGAVRHRTTLTTWCGYS